MDRSDIEYLVERLADVIGSHGMGGSGGSYGGGSGSSPKEFNVDRLIKSVDRFDKSIKKSSYEVEQMNQAMKELDEAIEAAGDTIDAEILHSKKKMIQEQKNMKLAEEGAAEFSKKLSTVGKLSAPVTAGLGNAIKSVTDGASATATASGVMNAGVDAIGGVAKSASEKVAQMGAGMAAVHPVIGGVVAGLGVLGGVLSDTLSKTAKFANDILSKEVEKTVKAYNQAASSGALFADGMTGLRNAASGAGLTVTQFADVIKKQSGPLAESGMGVVEGAKQVGKVGEIYKANNGKLQKEFLRMGFSFEETAEMSAEVAANMRRASGGKVAAEDVATQTHEYAKNLRLLSQLTGEDAKAKAEKVKQENTDLAFQLKLQGMSEKQRNQINLAMAAMSDQERKNLKDRMVYGTVVNRDGAIMEAMSGTARRLGEQNFALLQEGNLTAKEVLKNRVGAAADVIAESKQFEAFAMAAHAGGEAVQGAAKALADNLKSATNLSDADIEQVIADLEKSLKPGDKLQEGVIGAADAHQALQVQIQDELLPVMGEYAKLTQDIVEGLKSLLSTLGFSTPEEKELKAAEKKKKERFHDEQYVEEWREWKSNKHANIKKQGMGGFGESWNATLGWGDYSADNFDKHKENLKSSADRESSRYATLGKPATPAPKPAMALGGIAKGPMSGFDALLHGIEAVVPLPDGKTIPVKVNVPEDTAGKSTQTDSATAATTNILTVNTQLLSEQVDLMKQFIRKADDLISVTSDHKDVSSSILQSSY